MITISKVESFDDIGQEASIEFMKSKITSTANFNIQLIESQRIIKLNIPWGELYRRCTESEWQELLQLIEKVTHNS